MTEDEIVAHLVEEVMGWKCLGKVHYGVAAVEYPDGHQTTFCPFHDDFDFMVLMEQISEIKVPS